MPNYLVTLTMVIEARDKTEASVKALHLLNDSTNWQFNASVEEITEEEEGMFTPGEQGYCKEMCGNESPCIVDQCEDYKNKFKKD